MRAFAAVMWLWGGALVLAWAGAVWGARDEPETVCPGAELVEGSSYSTEFVLWPPGAIACDFTAPSGTVTRLVSFPWAEWGSVVLFAAAIACAVLAATGRRRRLVLGSATAVLMFGAFGVWFMP
jgi:hypothetical protein